MQPQTLNEKALKFGAVLQALTTHFGNATPDVDEINNVYTIYLDNGVSIELTFSEDAEPE
jgi:hypothetical protein